MGMSPEEIANILSGLAMTTARSQYTASGAQAAYGTTQAALSKKYQEDLEKQQEEEKKAGIFKQVGSMLGGLALAPFTGGMSIPMAAAATGAASAAGGALGGMAGGANNGGELLAQGLMQAVPGVVGGYAQQKLATTPVEAQKTFAPGSPVASDNGVPLNPDGTPAYAPPDTLKTKFLEALASPRGEELMQTITSQLGNYAPSVDNARIPIGLDATTAGMLRGEQQRNMDAATARQMQQQELGLRQQEVANRAAYQEGSLGLQGQEVQERIRSNQVGETLDRQKTKAAEAESLRRETYDNKRLEIEKARADADAAYKQALAESSIAGRPTAAEREARVNLANAQARQIDHAIKNPSVIKVELPEKLKSAIDSIKSLKTKGIEDRTDYAPAIEVDAAAIRNITDEEWQLLETRGYYKKDILGLVNTLVGDGTNNGNWEQGDPDPANPNVVRVDTDKYRAGFVGSSTGRKP